MPINELYNTWMGRICELRPDQRITQQWCLATNLPDRKMALKYYRLRMWGEEMHGDFKKHGFDLESTMLRDFLRLSA